MRALVSVAAVVVASLYVYAGLLRFGVGWRRPDIQRMYMVSSLGCLGMGYVWLSLLWSPPASPTRTLIGSIFVTLVASAGLIEPAYVARRRFPRVGHR